MKTYAEAKTSTAHAHAPPVPHALALQAQLRGALRRAGVQPRLELGAPDDLLEREADAVAKHVLDMPTPQTTHENFAKTKAFATETKPASPQLESNLNSLSSGGTPLDASSRAFFEPRFGQDLGRVRLHTHSSAAQMAKSIDAQAFTLGNNIAFGASCSPADKKLLGHELAHVIQQNGAQPNDTQQPNLHGGTLQGKWVQRQNNPTPEMDYSIRLASGSNTLTPHKAPSFQEYSTGNTQSEETAHFTIINHKEDAPADAARIEVLKGGTPIYCDTYTKPFQNKGEYPWQWDGYDQSGIFDTRVLKSADLKVRLTVTKGDKQQMKELALRNKAGAVGWVDTRVHRQSQEIELILRPSFSDGGTEGKKNPHPGVTARSFGDLTLLSKEGIEHYWSREGSRPGGIGSPINTPHGAYKTRVSVDLHGAPKANNLKLIDKLDQSFGRSRSAFGPLVYRNAGWWGDDFRADGDFKLTVAHEFGHFILTEYGGRFGYSWIHKGTSTIFQNPKPNTPYPRSGEVDIMKYSHEDHPPDSYPQFWDRNVAAEEDVQSLLWLSRVNFESPAQPEMQVNVLQQKVEDDGSLSINLAPVYFKPNRHENLSLNFVPLSVNFRLTPEDLIKAQRGERLSLASISEVGMGKIGLEMLTPSTSVNLDAWYSPQRGVVLSGGASYNLPAASTLRFEVQFSQGKQSEYWAELRLQVPLP